MCIMVTPFPLLPNPFSLSLSLFPSPPSTGRLNWWTSAGRLPCLEPLATSGDGNCLLHAASLYMWGFHDHFLILRTALHRLLTSGLEREGLKRRWRYQTQLRNNEAGGLTFSEEEWAFEWGEVLRIATNRPRLQPTTDTLQRYNSLRLSYESLEEIHIFVLAHTLRRPVIVISDPTIKDHHGQDLAPVYFGGIYLPLEVNPTACYKSPVVLAYDSSHFSSLVARQDDFDMDKKQQQKSRSKHSWMNDRKETVIPLVTPDGSLLPVQFIYDPIKNDVEEKWSKMKYEVGEFPDDIVQFLESYLNIRWIQLKVPTATSLQGCGNSDSSFLTQVPKVRFPAANITQEAQPIYQKELVEKYLDHIKTQYHEEKEKKACWKAEREEEERRKLQNMTVPCKGVGCDMFGRPATHNLCSICYQKMLIEAEDVREYGQGIEGVIGVGVGLREYEEEEEDRVDMHHRLATTMPPPSSPTYPQHIQRSPNHVGPLLQYGSSGASDAPRRAMGGDRSPVHDIGQSTNRAASPRRAVGDHSKSLSSPKHAQTLMDGAAVVSGSTSVAQHGSNLPLNVGALSPSRRTVQASHSSPTHPPPSLPSDTSSSSPSSSRRALVPRGMDISNTPRTVPPPRLVQTIRTGSANKKRAPPQPFQLANNDPGVNSDRASEHSDGSQACSSGSPLKKATSPAKVSGYARDNIQSLHLDPTQQTTSLWSEARSCTKKNCRTPGCDFFGSPKTGGYCSSCNKKQNKMESYV